MKKTAVLLICISLMTGIISGCSKNEFMDISRFTDNLNSQKTGTEISLSSYIIQNGVYSLPIYDGEESTLIRLVTQDGGNIEEIRLTIGKIDEEGNVSDVTDKRRNLFVSSIKRAIKAYTYFSEEETDQIIEAMKLNETNSYTQTGELTLSKGNFHFVYYSTDLAIQFMIYNIHLLPIEKTEKPVSRPVYGNTTNIRTETVPLK